jgi:hypothetical protein
MNTPRRIILTLILLNCFLNQSVPADPSQPLNIVSVGALPEITPNGLMTIFGKPQVLFKVASVGGESSAGQQVSKSYILGEGDQQDGIVVQKIDQRISTITFNNHGIIQKLPLLNGVASSDADSAPRLNSTNTPASHRIRAFGAQVRHSGPDPVTQGSINGAVQEPIFSGQSISASATQSPNNQGSSDRATLANQPTALGSQNINGDGGTDFQTTGAGDGDAPLPPDGGDVPPPPPLDEH